nr:NADH-ubiquinone oxidoreductase chain 2 [Pephricus paradoxus]
MQLNFTKMLFITILIMSTLITVSANNWLGMWMGLEINLMSFIPLISKNKNKKSSQGMMIYFLTQSIGSVLLLFSVLMSSLMFLSPNMNNELMKIMIMISLMIKLGAAPFHFWLPEMMANLTWMECFILMSWQKIAPLTILNNIIPNNWFLYLSVVASSLAGGVGGLNQTSLRKLLAYSSINHLGWMMMFMSMSNVWYKYLLIYSLLLLMICFMFNSKNIYFINQMVTATHSMTEKFSSTVLFLSLGGLPPFLGFLPKWMVIQSMIDSKMYMIMTVLMLSSLMTLFYYLRIMSSYILSYSTLNKWFHNPSNIFMDYLFLLTNLMLPMSLTMGVF